MPASARRRAALVLAFTVIFLGVPINAAYALPLFSFSSTTLAFPTTAVGGTSAGIDVTVTNVSGSPQTLSSVAGGAPGDANFDGVQSCGGVTLAPGASCAFTYSFTPQTVGPHSATTSFSINGESSGTISLSGTATPGFSIAPTTLAFPATGVGVTSAGMNVTVTNISGSPQTLSSVAGGAPGDPNFDGVQGCGGVTLAAGASCAFTYEFTPQTVGPHSATTSFSINGQSSGTISLSGTATPAFSITPTTLVFPTTPVSGTSAGLDVTVTNISGAPQLLSSVAGGAPGDPNFDGVQSCGGVTLAAGASCAFTYTFTPQTAGAHNATTSFSINGQSSGTISLSGTTATFSIAPTSLTFPSTAVGGSSAGQDVVVTNRSSTPQMLTVAGGAPGDPNFDGAQNCAGVTLAPNASCAFTYTFTPQTAGAHTATTSFTVNAQSSGTITLTGTAPGATTTPTPSASASPSTGGSVGGTLADTGSPLDPWALGGIAAATLLGAFMILRRRRFAL